MPVGLRGGPPRNPTWLDTKFGGARRERLTVVGECNPDPRDGNPQSGGVNDDADRSEALLASPIPTILPAVRHRGADRRPAGGGRVGGVPDRWIGNPSK